MVLVLVEAPSVLSGSCSGRFRVDSNIRQAWGCQKAGLALLQGDCKVGLGLLQWYEVG